VNGAFSQSYVYGSYIDEPLLKIDNAGNKIYYHANNLFSIAALTDNAGTVVERYKYDPYGKATVLAADGITIRPNSLHKNDITWEGRRTDRETNLMYFRQRMYSLDLGIFISRFYKMRVDRHFYRFQFNAPTNYDDPMGDPIIIIVDSSAENLWKEWDGENLVDLWNQSIDALLKALDSGKYKTFKVNGADVTADQFRDMLIKHKAEIKRRGKDETVGDFHTNIQKWAQSLNAGDQLVIVAHGDGHMAMKPHETFLPLPVRTDTDIKTIVGGELKSTFTLTACHIDEKSAQSLADGLNTSVGYEKNAVGGFGFEFEPKKVGANSISLTMKGPYEVMTDHISSTKNKAPSAPKPEQKR
jgi:RHS repeat-associated protein